MTNFASSISRNLDRLSLDEEHCKRNEVTRRSRPQGFGQGLVNGLSGVGIGLLGAIGGIAHHPLQAVLDDTKQQSLPAGKYGIQYSKFIFSKTTIFFNFSLLKYLW